MLVKNPLRTLLGLNHKKNKNIKALPKKGVLIKRKKCIHSFIAQSISATSIIFHFNTGGAIPHKLTQAIQVPFIFVITRSMRTIVNVNPVVVSSEADKRHPYQSPSPSAFPRKSCSATEMVGVEGKAWSKETSKLFGTSVLPETPSSWR